MDGHQCTLLVVQIDTTAAAAIATVAVVTLLDVVGSYSHHFIDSKVRRPRFFCYLFTYSF